MTSWPCIFVLFECSSNVQTKEPLTHFNTMYVYNLSVQVHLFTPKSLSFPMVFTNFLKSYFYQFRCVYMYGVCVSMCTYMHAHVCMCACMCRQLQREAIDHLMVQLQAVVSHPGWVLGTSDAWVLCKSCVDTEPSLQPLVLSDFKNKRG